MLSEQEPAAMRQAIQEGREGKGQEASAFFKELRAELHALHDVATIRQAIRESDDGKGRNVMNVLTRSTRSCSR
jgi:hypothetical protein